MTDSSSWWGLPMMYSAYSTWYMHHFNWRRKEEIADFPWNCNKSVGVVHNVFSLYKVLFSSPCKINIDPLIWNKDWKDPEQRAQCWRMMKMPRFMDLWIFSISIYGTKSWCYISSNVGDLKFALFFAYMNTMLLLVGWREMMQFSLNNSEKFWGYLNRCALLSSHELRVVGPSPPL